jgi:hypothetical protein
VVASGGTAAAMGRSRRSRCPVDRRTIAGLWNVTRDELERFAVTSHEGTGRRVGPSGSQGCEAPCWSVAAEETACRGAPYKSLDAIDAISYHCIGAQGLRGAQLPSRRTRVYAKFSHAAAIRAFAIRQGAGRDMDAGLCCG